MDSTEALLVRAFDAAIEVADPSSVLADRWPEAPAGRVVVLALGKASREMAAAARAHYRAAGTELAGVVVAPDGHDAPVAGFETMPGGHPIPDAASERAGARLLACAREAGEDDLVLLLISGGGSALAIAPRDVERADLAEVSRQLLARGAAIEDVNRVRRRLDAVKAGGLAAAAHPAKTVALIVSDVVGDDPLAIASGPASGDPDGPDLALDVLERYGVDLPSVRSALLAQRDEPRTGPPRPDDPRLGRCEVKVVASAARSLDAARRVLSDAGYDARVTSDAVVGDAREAAAELADEIERLRLTGRWPAGGTVRWPVALVSGGETTVSVTGSGQGGPNSTFALALLQALPPGAPVRALIADSDGIDGRGGHAGAFVRPGLLERLGRERARSLDLADDSHRAFAEVNALFTPGATGTNVNDVRLVLIAAPSPGAEA